MGLRFWLIGLAGGLALGAAQANAQEARIAFGDLTQDTTLPVEVTAQEFTINNADGTAVFTGAVKVVQGEMTLTAGEVRVVYDPQGRAIRQLLASGGVSITNLGDAATADQADYTVDSGVIVLTGGVKLAQGPSAMAGEKLTINLKDGTGVMEGGVTTTFVPGGN